MQRKERRTNKPLSVAPELLSEGLNSAQLKTLSTLQHFHWTLKFVRRPMFRDPIPVLVDNEHKRLLVIEPDGSINENPGIVLREERDRKPDPEA